MGLCTMLDPIFRDIPANIIITDESHIQSKCFASNWSIQCFHLVGSMMEQLSAYAAICRFRERYQMPGLKEFYTEIWINSSYIFSPLRLPSSGACADKTA